MAFGSRVLRDAATSSKGSHFIVSCEHYETGVLASGNSESPEANFNETPAGSVLAKLTDGTWRPAGFNRVNTASNTTSVTVDDTKGLYVGDSVFVYSNAGDTKINGSAAEITAINKDTGVVTLGATVNVAENDYVVVDTCDAALSTGDFGLLMETSNTINHVDADGTISHNQRGVMVVMRGVVRDDGIINYSAGLRRRLADRLMVVE